MFLGGVVLHRFCLSVRRRCLHQQSDHHDRARARGQMEVLSHLATDLLPMMVPSRSHDPRARIREMCLNPLRDDPEFLEVPKQAMGMG